MVSRVREATSEESNLVSTEVLKEGASHSDLSLSLLERLGDGTLGALNHEVEDLRVVQDFSSFTADISVHEVPLLVVVRVVESIFRALVYTVDERLDFMHLSVGDHKHWLASHGVNVLHVLLSTNPLSSNEVLTLISN